MIRPLSTRAGSHTSETTSGETELESGGRRLQLLARERGIYLVLVLAIVVASLSVPKFATGTNAKALLLSLSIEGLVALGMTYVIISGSLIDLSVPSQVALGSIVSLSLAPDHGVAIAVAAALGATLLVGLANGLIICVGGNPVLVTLALQTIVSGIDTGLHGGNAVYGHPHGDLERFTNANIGSIPTLILLFVVIAIVAQFILRETRFGFQIYAVGANRAAARISGVPVRRVLIQVFVISAILAGLCGVLSGAYGDQADANVGIGYEFYALTAVVVGGTSLFGGRGHAGRTVVGILLVGIVENVMILLNLSTNLQPVVLGAMIIIMVGSDALLRRSRTT